LTGNYLGILEHSISPATSTIIIGAFYSLGGLSILTTRKLGAALGIDALKIATGGLIALAVIGYMASQWRKFD
jgi:hypothetical protein